MNKAEILKIVARQLENNVAELSKSLEDYRAGSDMDEGDTKDMEDFSQQSEQKEMQYRMQIQLDTARASLTQLKDLTGQEHQTAKTGAVVETDENLFLLGISVPAIPVGNKELLGISPGSPAFSVINGKSKGDKFKLGEEHYTIRNVY